MSKSMLKKVLIIFVTLGLLIYAGIVYLNRVYLPKRMKALIVKGIEDATRKKVSLDSLNFNIFKGLVLKGLCVYDDKGTFFSLEEGSCTFLLLPIFKKNIILPTINFKSPVLSLERKADNTLNIPEFFPKNPERSGKDNYRILFYRITVTGGRVNFRDNTLNPVFAKSIDNLNLTLTYSLPNRLGFNLKGRIPGARVAWIVSRGGYDLTKKELKANVAIKELFPREFEAYYRGGDFNFPEGGLDVDADILLKGGYLSVDIGIESKGLIFSRKKISARINSEIEIGIRYSFKDKQLKYSGSAAVSNSALSGIEFADKMDGISGNVDFNETGLSSQGLKVNCLGLPFEANVSLMNFKEPSLKINAVSVSNLNQLQGVLKEKFKFVIPAQMQGQGKISVAVEAGPAAPVGINGSVELTDSTLKFEKPWPLLENINGKIEFSPSQLRWSGLHFNCRGVDYKTQGTVSGFVAPQAEFSLSSQELNLEANLSVSQKVLKFSRLKGSYLNSKFSFIGESDISGQPDAYADLSGSIDIDLADLHIPLDKYKDQIEKINPGGIVHAQGRINGNIKDIKSCLLQLKLSSDSLSLYGLKSGELTLDYNQEDGLGEITRMRLWLYDGMIEAVGRMNFSSPNLPYWVGIYAQGVDIEKLKMDTPAKNSDIGGILRGDCKINGFSGELSRLSGAGNIFISGGKLWELDLFKGLGKLIFAKDLARIVFSEGYCGFTVKDRSFFTDSLKLKSSVAELDGNARIGFDSSIDASIKVHILDEMIPLQNNIKDVFTTIIGRSESFGVIKITGTLHQPKYKFQPAVIDIFKGLKDSAIGNIF